MAKKLTGPLEKTQAKLAYLFVAPVILVLLVIGLYPLLRTFQLSFTDMNRFAPEEAEWVGFQNYQELATEPEFHQSVINTLVFTVSSVSLEFVMGLLFALVVNSKFKGRGLARAAMLIPWALPTVIAAKMWGWMYNDVYGVLNDLLVNKAGLLADPVAWTAQPGLAMVAVVLVDVWKTTPFVALLLLAGLQQIPGELYEAGEVDGAGFFRRFLHITLPLLKPAILVALIFRTLDALRVFDVIWVLTSGQFNTESMGTYTYRNLMQYSRLGYGATISVAIFLIIAIFVVLYVMSIGLEEE